MKLGRQAISAVTAAAAGLIVCSGTAAAATTPTTVSVGGHAIHLVLPRGASAAAAGSNNLVYNGGPVETAGSTNYAIFWEPSLTASVNSVSPQYNSLITRFFQDIGGSGLYGVASQYYQVAGGVQTSITNASSLGGTYLDTSPYPGPALTDLQIQAEVTKAIAANNWTGGIGHEFFVFTAKNEVSCAGAECSNAVFCAYHSSFSAANGQEILYANQPYTGTTPVGCVTPTSPNGDLAADSTINVVSHELLETVTDPSVGNSNYAWLDASGQEIGDKCNFTFGSTDSRGADLVANGHPYIVQSEWSNRVSACSMS